MIQLVIGAEGRPLACHTLFLNLRLFQYAGKAAGKARKYVGKISSKLVRNIKGEGADVAFLQASHSMNHGRSASSFDLAVQESTEFSGEDQAEEPLEKVITRLLLHSLLSRDCKKFCSS